MTPRIAAYETLLLCEKEKQFSNIAVNNGLAKYRFEGRDRDLYTHLVYGVIEKKLTIDYVVKQYTGTSIKRLDKPVVMILRLSIYQILFLDKIPNSAAVSEGVKLASRFASRAKGFINAVLRKVSENGIVYPDKSNLAEFYSIKYSVNQDICSLILDQYPNEAENILKAYNQVPHLCFQVNAKKYTPQAFIEQYSLDASPYPPLPYAVKMNKKLSLSGLPFLESGEAFVQDIASQLTTLVLDPKSSMTVIDVCSCPGGKSFSCANTMMAQKKPENKNSIGQILSFDVHESKLSLVEKGAQRLGFPFVQVMAHDATTPLLAYKNKAQRVICDVPCSGLGVIAKKPEIRYKAIDEIKALPELQYRILKASSDYLDKDGVLVYSTCTINKEENEDVVKRFIHENPNFTLVDFSFTSDNDSFNSQEGCLTLLPNTNHDGFFVAKIKRI